QNKILCHNLYSGIQIPLDLASVRLRGQRNASATLPKHSGEPAMIGNVAVAHTPHRLRPRTRRRY
ncbi:MAG: hypothetical protein WCO86_19225, partial [Planctomycetota bacterium]